MTNHPEPDALDFDALLAELQAEEVAELPEGFRSGFVAVVGQPNVGKSTLMNRLIGQKVAIVSPKPQTTRRRILGILTGENAQVVFVDTPGIHDPFHKLGEYMNQAAITAIPDADLVLFLVDALRPPDELDRQIATRLKAFAGPRLLILNKIDLVEQDIATARYEQYEQMGEWEHIFPISALEGHGVEGVLEAIVDLLPEGPLFYPQGEVTDQTEREIAAEIIREVALNRLEQEVPHSLNVEVEEWTERPNGKIYVAANIFVERESQKGIVIGAGGQMLKQISTEARRQIERELDVRLYLEVWVKVREKWRDHESWLNRWGYKPPRG
jgi:GTPase